MQDFIFATMLINEIDREAEKRRIIRQDPDLLYRYEGWDRGSGIISRAITGIAHLVGRRAERSVVGTTTQISSAEHRCAPQT